MSGGSYNYKYLNVAELADEIEMRANGKAHRIAFAKHMRDVAEACRAIEWKDSCDYDETEELRLITHALDRGAIEAAALVEIRTVLDSLRKAMQ